MEGNDSTRTYTINIGLELFGRSMSAAETISLVIDGKHSFDMGHSGGESIIYKSNNFIYVGYSHLSGKYESKLEIGGSIGIGKIYIDRGGLFGPIKYEHYANSNASFVFGYRYQTLTSGINLKLAFVHAMILGRKIMHIPHFHLGVGYSFGI